MLGPILHISEIQGPDSESYLSTYLSQKMYLSTKEYLSQIMI